MFSNGKSIAVWPVQRDVLFTNEIDSRLIDIQAKVNTLLSAGYAIYDVSASTNSGFNNLMASSSGNRVCIWKSAGSTAYTLYSTELASNGTNVVINATLNNMNQVTEIRDCKLTCSASSGLFVNKAEFYGGDWYIASWTTGSNVKFTNCNVYAYSSEVYMPDVNFEYCNVNFKRSGTIAYSTFKANTDTRFVNMTTAGSTQSLFTMTFNYSTDTDWFTRCTLVGWQNTGTPVLSSTAQRTFNFTGLKIENSNLAMTNLYTTEGSKIYYEGQDITLSGSNTANAWAQMGSLNISASSGTYPSMAVDQNGIPYVAFRDNSSTPAGKASCYKYGSTGWSVVGYAGFSSNTMDYINLCISTDNDVVIVGRDNSSKASAYYLSAAASSWNLLGSAGFSTNSIRDIKASYCYSTNNYKIIYTVVLSNTSNTNGVDDYHYNINTSSGWTYSTYRVPNPVMSLIAIDGPLSISYASSGPSGIIGWCNTFPILTQGVTYSTSTSLTYLACENISVSASTVNFNYYAVDASSMLYRGIFKLADYSTGTVIISTGTAKYVSSININSIPYVAIQDTTGKATVYKYVSANSSWNLVGTAAFSTDNVTRVSLASFGNTPYLAVEETGVAQGITAYSFGEVVSNSNVNYSFDNLESDVFDGELALNITGIQTSTNYITQNCNVRPGYNIVDTVTGRFIRQTYTIELNPRWNPPVNESIKNSNVDAIWVIKRPDCEASLNGKIVKNLLLKNSDLSDYAYQSNDNLLLITNNAQKGAGVFMLYNGKIKGTVFSDWFLDASYTITDVCHLLEINEISELQNIVSSTKYSGGPLENGSFVLNALDNEVIV